MSRQTIRAVAFDLGGTLEDIYYDDDSRLEAARGLQQLMAGLGLDTGLALPEFRAIILKGMKAYQEWRESTEGELPPERVWTEYIFPDLALPKERLEQAAEDLAFFYENHYYTRALRPEVPAVLSALRERGFRLAVISNVTSRRSVQHNLAVYGVSHYFNPIVTSVELGIRKPNPKIFVETARRMSLSPAACAYVGDTVSRDVVGARRADYGLVIQIQSFLTSHADRGTYAEAPDAVIENLNQVLALVLND